MAFKIVEARHEAQIDRAMKDREEAARSALSKQTKARTAAGIRGKGDVKALQGLDHRGERRRSAAAFASAVKSEATAPDETENGEDEGGLEAEEDDDGDNSIGGSISTRGSLKRKDLENQQARLSAEIAKRLKEDQDKKRKADPLLEVVDLLKQDIGTGAGGGGDAYMAQMLERWDKKEGREADERQKREQREKEKHELEQTLMIDKYMREHNLTPSQLPAKLKKKWEKLNQDSDEE